MFAKQVRTNIMSVGLLEQLERDDLWIGEHS